MPNTQYFIAAGVAGIGGAIVVAVLALGGSETQARVAFAELDYGGVMMVRTEIYQRHGDKAESIATRFQEGQLGLFPERYVTESWALLAPRGAVLETATASWDERGELVERSRGTADGTLHERPWLGVTDQEPPPDGGAIQLGVLPSQLQNQSREEFQERVNTLGWEVQTAEPGTLRIAAGFDVQPGTLVGGNDAFVVPYFGDLAVVRVVRELIYESDYTPRGEERYAILEDGTRQLVESRATVLEVRSRSEWDAFVADVWAD